MMLLDHPKYGLRPWRRHSLVLLIGGLVYMGYGFAMFSWTYEGPRASGIQVALVQAPLEFWGSVWMLTGFLAVLSARWPAVSEHWGYTVLTGLAAGWSATYLAGLFVANNSVAEATGGLVWALVAFLWWAITGLINPDRVVVVEVPTEAPNEQL